MKEHMDVPIDTSNMSEQELQFHYFKMLVIALSDLLMPFCIDSDVLVTAV